MTKLTAIGGHALVIDEKILSTLGISPETELVVFVDRGHIVIEPADGRPAPPRRRGLFWRDPAAPPAGAPKTKLVAVGDGQGVIIDETLLALVDVASNTKLDVTTDGHRILVERILPVPWFFRDGPPLPDDDPDHPGLRPPGWGWRRSRPMVRLPKKQPW